MGLDSLMAVELARRIGDLLEARVSTTTVYNHSTIHALATPRSASVEKPAPRPREVDPADGARLRALFDSRLDHLGRLLASTNDD